MGMNRTAPNLGTTELHYRHTQPILWYRHVAPFGNEGGLNTNNVDNQGQISRFLTPCKTLRAVCYTDPLCVDPLTSDHTPLI